MSEQRKRILILGHGAMGTMFEQLLAERHDLALWERDPDTGKENAELEMLAADREIVFFALPAHPHHELAGRLAGALPDDAVCLTIAKGIDNAGRTPALVFERILEDRLHWGVIYGPMIARDIKRGKSGFAVLASGSEPGRRSASLFDPTPLYLDAGDDVHGASWAVVLKNVYVPLIGAADALDAGDNVRGFLIGEAMSELEGIITEMGGRAETADGPAGLGDLIASATSESSHHRTIGADLAAGRDDKVLAGGEFIRSEGVHTARRVREHALVPRGRYRLFDLATDFLTGSLDFDSALNDYLRRRFSHRNPE